MSHCKVIIIGSGPAGYTAAIYAARAMLDPMLIAGFEPGGQLMITTDVENYPGFAAAIQGPWLMEQMRAQAEHVGARMTSDTITAVDLSDRPFRLTGDSGQIYTCDALIIATGAKAKWLNTPSEERFRGFGVSACATCDGFFFRGKNVLVVGGGNSAVEEALYLANLAAKVTIVHRRHEFRGGAYPARAACSRIPRSRFCGITPSTRFLGNDDPKSCHGHTPRKTSRPARPKRETVDGVFVAIGHAPASELFAGQIDMKGHGYIKDRTRVRRTTNIPGVFAAGDVADDIYRQAVTAAGLGCMAALESERYPGRAACRLPPARDRLAAELDAAE